MSTPARSEAYQCGHSRGVDAANYAVAYENADRSAEAPAPSEEIYAGFGDNNRSRWDFEAGYNDGWTKFMNEDFPD